MRIMQGYGEERSQHMCITGSSARPSPVGGKAVCYVSSITSRLATQDRSGHREGDLYRQAQQALPDGGNSVGQTSAALPWQQKQLTELQGEQRRHTQERQQQQQSEAREAEQRAEAAERNRKDEEARQVSGGSASSERKFYAYISTKGVVKARVRCVRLQHVQARRPKMTGMSVA